MFGLVMLPYFTKTLVMVFHNFESYYQFQLKTWTKYIDMKEVHHSLSNLSWYMNLAYVPCYFISLYNFQKREVIVLLFTRPET